MFMKQCVALLSPSVPPGVTNCYRVVCSDVETIMQKAIGAGATEIDPTTDHEYGTDKGMFRDPFGHYWQIQQKI